MKNKSRKFSKLKEQKGGTINITDDNISTAVNMWCSNEEVAKGIYGPISEWDTSYVTNMSKLFANKRNFNDDISKWDVANVTNMESMFSDAYAFNQPLE